MWMTVNQLLIERIGHICHIELSLLLCDLSIEQDMEQHIAELLADIGCVIIHQGLTKLVDLLYGVGAERRIGLLPVPRTLNTQTVECINNTPYGFSLELRRFIFHRNNSLCHVRAIHRISRRFHRSNMAAR